MNTAPEPFDTDLAAVQRILSAAARGPQDPDVELAVVLSELAHSEQTKDVDRALVRLASSAHSDSG